MKLVTRTKSEIVNPARDEVIAAFQDVLSLEEDENGYTSIRLVCGEGFILTAYGIDLVILEHEDRQNYLPSHISDLSKEFALSVILNFWDGSEKRDLDWVLGYG